MSIKILLAPTLELARPYGVVYPCRGCDTLCMGCTPAETADLTVEAEYGTTVINGRLYTAAHHQPEGSPYAGDHVVDGGRPSPCVDENIPRVREGVVLLSHIDLDSVGGALRALGWRGIFGEDQRDFWSLAAFVDVRGPHRIAEWASTSSRDEATRRLLRAYWAWAKNRPRFSRDAVSDVTDEIISHGEVLAELLGVMVFEAAEPVPGEQYEALMAAGDALAAGEKALNAASFVRRADDVLVRQSDQFVSALYADPDGRPARAVVALNTGTGTVTVSLAEPVPGVSCRAIVQALWGPDAGGHDGIAGSPRGRVMDGGDLDAAVRALRDALRPPATCGHCGQTGDICDRATSPGADCVALVREPRDERSTQVDVSTRVYLREARVRAEEYSGDIVGDKLEALAEVNEMRAAVGLPLLTNADAGLDDDVEGK